MDASMVRLRIPATLLTAALGASLLAHTADAAKKLAAPDPLEGATATGQVKLTWSNIAGETGYVVERRLHATGSFAEVAKTTTDLTSYTDVLTESANYEYRVRAYKAGADISYSPYTNTLISTVPCE
jgi:large repetitive protein